LPLHSPFYKLISYRPSGKTHRPCWVGANTWNMQSTVSGTHCPGPDRRPGWAVYLNRMPNILCRTVCKTRKIREKSFYKSPGKFLGGYVLWDGGRARGDTYLKKSSLQNNWPFREKHFSFSWELHSLHCKHLACHVRSATLRMKRSSISSWQPPHLGIVAGMAQEKMERQSKITIDWVSKKMERCAPQEQAKKNQFIIQVYDHHRKKVGTFHF
jgi:hypothetical protein